MEKVEETHACPIERMEKKEKESITRTIHRGWPIGGRYLFLFFSLSFSLLGRGILLRRTVVLDGTSAVLIVMLMLLCVDIQQGGV